MFSFPGVDNVGTVCASLITYASIQALQPDLIINAGTAGGFKVLHVFKGPSINYPLGSPNQSYMYASI